jgi:hypothetical protein
VHAASVAAVRTFKRTSSGSHTKISYMFSIPPFSASTPDHLPSSP